MPADVNVSNLMKCAFGNKSGAQSNGNSTHNAFGANTTQSSIPRDAGNTSIQTQNPQSSNPFNFNLNPLNSSGKNDDEKMNTSELDWGLKNWKWNYNEELLKESNVVGKEQNKENNANGIAVSKNENVEDGESNRV